MTGGDGLNGLGFCAMGTVGRRASRAELGNEDRVLA